MNNKLNGGYVGETTSEQMEAIINLSRCTYAEDLVMAGIRRNAPDGATHYLTIMFLGLVYIKYIDDYSWWFDESIKQWIKTKAYTESKPLN